VPEVHTDDAKLFCEVDGAGAPVTVVAHGLTNNRNELAAFTPMLPGTTVRFDFRGHGKTVTAPDARFRFEDFARDVDAVAEAYGATAAMGTSLGAGALGNLVCRVPDRFERMVWLLPAGLDVPFPLRGRYHELAGGLEGKTPAQALESIMSDPAKVAERIETPWRWEIERVLWEHDDFDALARAIHGVIDDWPIPDRELLRAVQIPTLIVGMDGDEVHPVALARLLADLLPDAELVILQDQADLFRRIPELVARVSSFLLGEG
jgi:pimeloyl-ACP methyl ester carboxylesterase